MEGGLLASNMENILKNMATFWKFAKSVYKQADNLMMDFILDVYMKL